MPAAAQLVSLPGAPVPAVELLSPNGRLRGVVAPHDGGGLASLRVAGRELLYRAGQFEAPPEGQWMGRAPLLWPAVGRNFTPQALASPNPQCCFERDGVVYDLPIHGFTRHCAWQLVDHGAGDDAWVTVELRDDEATRRVYPWPFHLRSTHRLTDAGYSQTVAVSSPVDLPFGIGNHITVLLAGAEFAGARLAGSVTAKLLLSSSNLVTPASEPEDLRAGVALDHPRYHNGVFGKIAGEAWLAVTWPDGRAIRVAQEVTVGADLVRPEDVLFVLYANRELGYYCPEPWIGRPNGLQSGEGVVNLPAGRPFEWTWRLEVTG